MEELFMKLIETIDNNTWMRGIDTYNFCEVNRDGLKRQYSTTMSMIIIDNDTVMFIDSDDDITKFFLLSSVKDIIFNADEKDGYKILFVNGSYMIFAPLS